MEDLLCKKCNKSYDNVDRIPKIIPISNKTICSSCIIQTFDFSTNSGVCPFSGQKFE